ncbi:NAD(P)H-binding protein [Sodalis sp. dw_96]|uniref:NAD(P)H-binding protein n=1 Tax=Sodalis sp. dw_96 TaxID=2719794 RepID=UPI001BD3AF79|nr:NAD(P)H-binding protein [Sodalis sp. dw_96]
MKVIIWGATGMVGQGVLRECLRAEDVISVVAVGRSAPTVQHFKLQSLIHEDLLHYDALAPRLSGLDACFFCLGVSSMGMSEQEYTRITHEMTLAAATALVKLNPSMTFVYLSGSGADSTGKSRTMWERVRGGTENALRALGFKSVYILRPGIILPRHGAVSKTPLYRNIYRFLTPLLSLIRPLCPGFILTTEVMGLAMLNLARQGFSETVLNSRQINNIAQIEVSLS